MLRAIYDSDGETREGDAAQADLARARWIDLFDPDPGEVAQVAERFGITVPSRDSLAEIEASSRLRADGDRLTMSAPLIGQLDGRPTMSPSGYMLDPDLLVTVRFAELGAFDAVHKRLAEQQEAAGAQEIMIRLLEEIVDRAADRLERLAETVAETSHAIFSEPEKDAKRHKVGRETRRLRALMVRIGRSSEEMVKVRHSFLSIGRIAGFLLDRCQPRIEDVQRARLETVRRDIDSLDEFEESLSGRVQMLLDAATGFISIEQNDVVKVLTVASVAGVPPVVIAGIYGMNFHYMPELDWRIGYPMALAAMVVTTLIPILWFKWRDWL